MIVYFNLFWVIQKSFALFYVLFFWITQSMPEEIFDHTNNNKNKLNFENDLIQDENDIDIDINIDPNRNINLDNQKLENDFVE